MEDDERTQKLKAGKQKLAEFQKKRKKKTHLPKDAGEEEPVTVVTHQSEASLSSSGDVSFSDSDQGMTETAPDLCTELYAAYDRIEELEESLTGKQLALDKVISENDQLQRKIQESKLNDLESAVKKREELIVQLSSALQTVTSQTPSDAIATEMAQEVQNLKSQLLNASKMLETQTEKYRTTTQTLQEAKAEISILQKHLRERDKGQEVKGSLATNQEEPSQLQAANEERLQLEQELLEARNQIASLQERLQDNSTGNDEKLGQILGELEALQEVVTGKDHELLDLQSRVSASEEERDKLQSRISDIEEERDRLSNIVSNLEARILENDRLKEENDKLKTNIQDVEERSRKELEQIKNENIEVLENLRNENAKEAECLLNECDELKSKLGEFENSIKETTEMKLKMKDLEEKLKEMEEKSASESGVLDLMRTDYELLTDTLKLKNERIAELERSVTEEKHEIEIELLRGDNELLSEQVRSLEEKLEGSEKNIAEKGRQLEFVRTEVEELESRLRDKDEMAFMYETSINNLQREKEQQALEMDQLNEELENALLKCKRTDELDLQLESLVSQLNGLQQECQCYRVQNDELKNKINVQQDLYLSQQYQIEVAGREKEELLTENQRLGVEKEELRQEVMKLQVAMENSGIAKSEDLMEGNVESRKKVEKEMNEVEAKIRHLKEENLSWKMKVQSMEDKILDLQKDLEVSQDSTAAEIGKLHDFYKQEILDKDDVINSLQTEIKNYKANTKKENNSAAVGKHEDWKTSENSDGNSITNSMMESMVEDLLCQSEAAIEKEAGYQKEDPIANWEKENVCEEIELVQEEMIPVSHINLLTSCEDQSSKLGKDNGGDQDEPLELCASNIGADEEEISHLHHSLSAPRDSEVTEEGTIQSSLSENESSRLDNTEEEIRSVLNLESSVSLDSENFLMILKTLENQKHHLLEKLKRTEAERDKLRSKFQNTKTDEISDDSLNLDDSIDEDDTQSQPQFVEDGIIVREETNESFAEGSIVDETEDGVDGPDSLEVIFPDTSSPDNGAMTRILDKEGAPPAHEMETGRQEGVTMAVEPKKTQVSPCMLSSGAAASSVSVDALTNSSSVYVTVDNVSVDNVTVDNVTVQISPTVSTTAHNAGELSNVTDPIPPGVISSAFGSGDLNNKNTKTVSGDFTTDTSANVSSFDSAMASEDIVNVSEMEDLSFTRIASLLSKNESLQIKIDSLVVELDRKSGECEDLKDRYNQVSNRFDVFKASFSDISVKNENLEYENEDLSSKLENLQKELEDVRADYSSLQDHYDMVGDENHSLRYEHDQLIQKYEAVMSENSSLLQSLSDSDVMGTKILRESEEIVTKLGEMEEENSRLSQKLSRSEKARSELEAEIEGLSKKLDKGNVNYESLLLEKSELAENHRKLINEMKIVQKEKLDSLRKSQNLQQQLELQIQEIEDVRCAKISELESRVDELRGQNRTLTFDRQNAESKINSLELEAEKLREEHELLLCQREDKMRRLSEELDGLRSSVQQKDTELHTIKGILRDSENTNHQLQRKIATLQANNTELGDKLTLLEKQLESKDREGETVQKQCQELTEALSQRDNEITELRGQLKAVEERLKVEQGEREKAQRERKKAQSENDKAQEERQLLVETLTQKEKLLVQRQSAEKETETKLEEKMTRISEIEEQLSNKEREFDNLAAHLEERKKAWKEELSVKDSEIDRLTSSNKETQQLVDGQNQQRVEDIRQTEMEIQRIEAELSQKLDAEREMKEKIEQQIKKMDAKEIQIKDYQLKLSQLTNEIDSNQKKIEDMKSSHEKSVEVLKEKVRHEAVVNKDLLVKISALEESNAALGKQLNEVEEKCERLKSELRSEVESRLNEKHHQIEQLREDIGELKENIGSSEQTEEGIPVLESLGKLQTALSRITDSMRVETGGGLQVEDTASLQVEDTASLQVEDTASLQVEDTASQHPESDKLENQLVTGGGLQVEDTPSQHPESDKLENQSVMIVEAMEQTTDKSTEQATAESCQTTDSVTKVTALVEIHELKESVKALQAQVQGLQKDKNHLKTCLKEATQGLSQGDREEMEAVLEENSHLMEEIKALSGELEKLKSRAEKEEKTVTYSDNTEDQLQKKFDILTMENRNLKQSFSDLEREIEQGQSQILQMTLMFEQSVSANEVLRDEILSLKEELENIAESRETVDLALTNMEQRVSRQEVRDDLYSSKVKSEVIQPSKDSSKVESEVTWPSEGSSEVKSEATQPREDSSEVKSEVTQPSRDSSKVTQPNEDSCGDGSEINQLGEILVSLTLSNSQNVLLKEENEKLKSRLLEKEKLIENSFHQMENDSSVIVERSKTIEGELEDARKTLAEREELIHILEEQVKLVSRENSEMREERETIIEEVKVHRDITSEMRDSVEKSRQDVSEIRKEQSGFKLKMDEIIEEKDKLARDLMKRITENQELRTKVGILSIENDTLKQSQESFERVKAERDELLSMQEKLLEDLTEMQGRYEAVHSMMEETKQECNSEMERLRQQLGAVNRDVGSLKTSIDVLQSELQSTQEQKEQLMSSLEERTGELGVTEKERVKEVNDKINKELQNQRRACVGSINAEACGGPSNVESSKGSINAEALMGPNNEAYRGSTFDEATPDDADVVDSRSRPGNSYDREIETVESDHNSSKEENIENGGMGECGMEEDNQEEILRPDSLAAVSERDSVIEETEMVSEGKASEQSFVEKSDEQDGMDTELERDSIRQELETEYNQKVEGLRYEMEERLEMSLKDKEFELLGKFDVEKRALVQQMEQSLGQRMEAVKAEKHKEFVEAMQRVRKDQGRKLQKEVKGRHRVQKQLQEVSEERDELRSELSHLHQKLSRTQVGTMIDSVFTEPDQFQQSSPSHLNSSFISESISPPSSLNLGSDQEWFCGNSACQKMFHSYKDLSDRMENIAFRAPGSGRSDVVRAPGSGRSDVVTDDRNVEQGFQPEILGEERLLDETNFGLGSAGSDVMRDQKNRKRHKSLGNEQDGNDRVAELAQGFQPECDEVFSENIQDGEYLSESQKIQIGFNPAEHESFKDIRDQDLQASRLSLNLDSTWESQGVQRSISEDCPPQFSPELKKLKVFPASAPVHHFLKEPDEGFIPSKHGGDNADSNDGRRMSETEDSENETIPAEKLLRIQESELHLLKNKIEEMMDEKSELTEKCLTLNTRVEQEILLRQGLEQELNSLVEDLSTTEPASNAERPSMSDNPQKNDGSDGKERKASSLSIESLESKLKGLSFLYEKEKQLREGLELKLNTEKLYRKDLEKEIKSLSIGRDPPLSAGPHIPGGKSSRRGRTLTQRQFSYEAEDAGQQSGDNWTVLSLFCSEHYRDMESRVHQLQFQNQFLSEKIRIVESLNNGERKALVEKNRKLESELKELRHGSVFVEEDEELVVEDVMRSSSGPGFLTEEDVKLTKEDNQQAKEGSVEDLKSKSSSGPGFLTEEDVKLTKEDIQQAKEGSVEDLKSKSSSGPGFRTEEDVKLTKEDIQQTEESSMEDRTSSRGPGALTKKDVKKTKKASQQTKEDGKQTKKGIMEDKVDDNSKAGAGKKQVYFEDTSTGTSLVKKGEPEKLLSEEISVKSEEEISSTSQKKNQEDVNELREMLNALNTQLELLRRDNLSLQLEMKEKDDFLEHVESRTKDLVSDLKREQSECTEARQRGEELGQECLNKEQVIKEIAAELSTLKDRLDEEKLKNSSLKLELGKIRDQEVLNLDRSCQTEELLNGDVKFLAERTREVETVEVQTDPDLVYTGHVGSQAEEVNGKTKDQRVADGVRGDQTSEKETQAECGPVHSEDGQTQTDTGENHKVSQNELEAMKLNLQEKEDYIKRLEDELDQMETSGEVEDPGDLQEFQEYRDRTERALKEKESYIRKLEEHLLGRETPERNLKALQEKLCVEEAPKVEVGGESVEGLHIHIETDETHKNPPDETADKADVKATIDPLLPWHSPLDDLSEPSNYSVRSASHLEISTSVPEVIPESRDLFSPGLSVCSTGSTFSGGSWDQGLERIVSGLGPEEDGHKALEHKHFELIDEISNLRKDLKETKSIYTQENALLQEALDRERWMSGSLRSKLGMSNTVVNFDLSAEIVSLRQKVSVLQETNKMLQTENDRWMKRIQEQERLVMEFKGQQTTNRGPQGERDEAFTRQVALLQQHRQELMDQLKERELENNKLSSKLGDQMILEENLRREKDLLKVKLSERESIEEELHEKKMELQRQVGYQRKLEDIIYHKNLIEKELMKQKRLLEMDFLEIESKLQEKEELLEIQRSQLLRELRMKDQNMALGSEAGSEVTGSRIQSPSFSETSSIHSVGLMSRGSRHQSVDLNVSRSSEMVSGCHSVDLNVSRSSEREAGRVGVMLTDAEKQHLSAIEFLKGKLKPGSDQNLHKRESQSTQRSHPLRGSTGDVGKGSGHPRQHSGSLGSGDHTALE